MRTERRLCISKAIERILLMVGDRLSCTTSVLAGDLCCGLIASSVSEQRIRTILRLTSLYSITVTLLFDFTRSLNAHHIWPREIFEIEQPAIRRVRVVVRAKAHDLTSCALHPPTRNVYVQVVYGTSEVLHDFSACSGVRVFSHSMIFSIAAKSCFLRETVKSSSIHPGVPADNRSPPNSLQLHKRGSKRTTV